MKMFLVCWLMAVTAAFAVEPGQPSWKVAGQLEEACSCNAACPCWFKAAPTRMTCSGAQVIFIKKGNYGKTKLDGLSVGQFVQSPENKSMFESFGKWKFDNVYIDESATEEQRAALKVLANHFFPPPAAKREYFFTSITRRIEGSEHIIKVGAVGHISGHLSGGGFAGAPKITNPPLADPTHKEYLQGETTLLTYSDAGQNWKFEKSNYMFNEFVVDNKVYEKYQAEMAKKMAAK